ncbi:23S rRNA (uracil1939-C5)-methyltransferase [Carboxydocella sporoproducens DSM 16521]|uniref:23S rRNA (Uracil1939-C5)-methyltransferase n=2 Tax=Carboxydocella TaxID=178898 RepID=A0A1T4QTZ4_9FIRM|nr:MULTISPECIES: 23S rRNA (uracil(1939)-C(5))-methyltransferase RlmD [Carboxydocella]AVX21646.1 23S rRNA m(5)U-1939 methyltransferase [Carboxydocella thermautotrophica]SKA07232.1 23S rRNA (uracil1939-C5)-methyltransferase [Carboxydocella sporoproducens DSM 16521]
MKLIITDINHQGEGVGRLAGKVYFVPGALPGEEVEIEVTEEKKSWARARIINLHVPSAERCQPHCPYFEQCGGCQLQQLAYSAQLAVKRELVQNTLKRIGKLDLGKVEVRSVLGMVEPWQYRNKVVWHVTKVNRRLRLGFFQRGGQQIIPIDYCLLLPLRLNQLKNKIEHLLNEINILPYDWRNHTGQLRHIILRQTVTGQVMVGLVTVPEVSLKRRLMELASKLLGEEGVTTVVWNINQQKTREILGRENQTLAGPGFIEEEILGLKFQVSLAAFLQVNPRQTEVLYQQAAGAAALSGGEKVIDAYCGVGSIALLMARQAAEVRGVEVVAEAIAAARVNATINRITNASFRVGLAEKILPEWEREGYRAQVIVVDPPRAGVELPALQAMAGMKPERIVYVACDVATLARDLARLQELGYEPKWVQPVDMFPHTAHVECCCCLKRKKWS